MEGHSANSSAEEIGKTENAADQAGAQAVEALMRAIAQEFVLAFDDFHDAVLAEDDVAERPKVQAAGS